MFGKPDPKKIMKLMQKMNMNVKELEAKKVIIKCASKDIVISNPDIMVVDMMGKDVYQISGDAKEKTSAKEEDIKLVMKKTGKDRETVAKKLEELDNDLAKAIMELKKK